MTKAAQDRINDTLDYIRNNVSAGLALEMNGLIGANAGPISEEISLGARFTALQSAATTATETQQRRALRALMLCQRIYFSDLWPCLIGVMAAPVAINRLPTNWAEQSRSFWENRSEGDIRAALQMYIATTDNPDMAANAAIAGQPSMPAAPYLTQTRASFTGGSAVSTCYDAVMVWLFKSGLVSLRWLLKHRSANTEQTLTDAFGRGNEIWRGDFTAADNLPVVPRGHIVHIYEDPAISWRGHWMISTGNGQSAGCNNNKEVPPVNPTYCPQLTLDKQFLDYTGNRRAAIVINPSLIPGRL